MTDRRVNKWTIQMPRLCPILSMFCLLATAQNIPKTYIAQKTNEPIQIDGIANELSWNKASWSDEFIDIEGIKIPKYRTQMKMIWDDRFLYFFAQLEEPHVWGTLKQRDTVIFYNNDFEIFIDPDGDTHNYYEFEMNALNTVWDLLLTKPYRNQGKVIDSWDIRGLQTAVHVNGTLNDPNLEDADWSVEIAIPWEVLVEASSGNRPPENEFWRINFSRVNWEFEVTDGRYTRKKDANGKFLPEYNWVWSSQGVINMHEPEHWGYVFFSNSEVGKTIDFEIPKEEHIKWYLYELYRDFRDENKRKMQWGTVDGKTSGDTKELFGKSFVPMLEYHESGFNIWTKSPFSGKKLVVNQDGKFTSFEDEN